MLPTSVRRVVSTAPSSPVVASLASSAPRAAASASAYARAYKPAVQHQRRYSSSNPSSPDDGSRDFAARPTVPTSGGSKTTGEKRKRKAKDAAPQLPSVPSTRHIKDEALALSTFFALHRPISVTQLLPKTVTDDAFARIFHTKSRGHNAQDIISTLASTVNDLEQPLSRMSLADNQEAGDGSTKLSLKHPDGTETNVYVQLDTMSGHYLPFTPPPPPQPISDAIAEADETVAAAAEEMVEQEPQTRVYKAMVTIEETIGADGQVRVLAHSPQVIEDPVPMRGRTMQTMSVKRIRKLKMKKQKYKKLRRRTRNERRKLDRL